MGVELDRPVINEQSLKLNYTNEVGRRRQDPAAEEYRGAVAVAGMQARLEPGRARSIPTTS